MEAQLRDVGMKAPSGGGFEAEGEVLEKEWEGEVVRTDTGGEHLDVEGERVQREGEHGVRSDHGVVSGEGRGG